MFLSQEVAFGNDLYQLVRKPTSNKEGTNDRNVSEEKSSLNGALHFWTPFYPCPLPARATELKADSLVAYDLVLTKQGLF